MSTIHCVYASKASPGFREIDLPQLLQKSRTSNAARGVTGMLLFIEGSFFQVLEGGEADVKATYDRICLDDRHGQVSKIISEPIFGRDFPEWAMGYARPRLSDLKQLMGDDDFFASATCLENLSPGRARKLLSAFRQDRWRADETGLHRTHAQVA
jgi:hypothetical protein